MDLRDLTSARRTPAAVKGSADLSGSQTHPALGAWGVDQSELDSLAAEGVIGQPVGASA